MEKLASLSGGALAGPVGSERLPNGLADLLSLSNGFFAFESALHVFPSGAAGGAMSVQLWNDPDLWRGHYGGMADGLFFFAEDIFGAQFAFDGDAVVRFDPETGDVEAMAADLEGWADLVLADYARWTGFPLAHAWQVDHGRLAPSERLLPKRPFVLGGDFVPDNLYALPAVEGMRLRGELAVQIRDLPEGASVRFKIVE